MKTNIAYNSFEVETTFYYLNSRYYDPEVGRFISPDLLSILDETIMDINGLNLYMYCGNNSVMRVGINTAVGGLAGWFGGAGTQNVKSVGNAMGVQIAAMSLKTIQNRMVSGVYYATERGMRLALTQATNKMMLAVGNQMFKMFTGSMVAFGLGTIFNNVAVWIYTLLGGNKC